MSSLLFWRTPLEGLFGLSLHLCLCTSRLFFPCASTTTNKQSTIHRVYQTTLGVPSEWYPLFVNLSQ